MWLHPFPSPASSCPQPRVWAELHRHHLENVLICKPRVSQMLGWLLLTGLPCLMCRAGLRGGAGAGQT